MKKVLVPAHFLSPLRERLGDLAVELIGYDAGGSVQGDSHDAVALFRWWLTAEQGEKMMDDHPGLRWVHSGSAGVDHILTASFRKRAVTLTNSSGVHAPSIAEWVVATMLYVEKDLGRMLAQQRAHVWEKSERSELSVRTVVFLGAGAIASTIAERLRPFGARLIAVRRQSGTNGPFDDVMAAAGMLDAVAQADWLVVALPLADETRGLVDRTLLAAMKPTARLINVARGEVVDEHALVDALRDKRIAGAVLDVLEQEPPPDDHPLWEMENVILLPHTTWRSPEVRERQLSLFLDNLQRFVQDEPLRNVVNVARGY